VATPKPAAVAQPTAAPKPAAVKVSAAAAPVAAAKVAAKPAAVPAAAKAAPQAPMFPEVELPPDSLVGTTVGDYHIEAKIAATAFAGIYRAHQQKMNRKVRFYALDTRTNPPAEQIEKFKQDAVAKAKVKQPFILSVYEAGEADGVLFYSTEYLPGRTVEQLAESGQKLDGPSTLAILKTVTDAMEYLQKSEIPHSKLSPKSIVLT
jgi:serine/threonine protein kinase